MRKGNGVFEAKVNLIAIPLHGNILKEEGIIMPPVAEVVTPWKKPWIIS